MPYFGSGFSGSARFWRVWQAGVRLQPLFADLRLLSRGGLTTIVSFGPSLIDSWLLFQCFCVAAGYNRCGTGQNTKAAWKLCSGSTSAVQLPLGDVCVPEIGSAEVCIRQISTV